MTQTFWPRSAVHSDLTYNTRMKLLLLLAFVAVGQCALLGSKKCTYGPAYWCSHIHHAKECGALQHCMTTVWKNQDVAMTGTTETCFDVIKILDAVRKSPESELLSKMAVGCTGMQAGKRSVCKELMSHDQGDVFKLMSSDLPSARIASVLGLCGGSQDAVTSPIKVKGDYCTDCVNFFGDLREIFNNTEGQAEAMVKDLVCSKLGPLQQTCDQLVDQYANLIFSQIYQQLNPKDICFLLQLCQNQSHAELFRRFEHIVAKGEKSIINCDTCQSIAKDVQNALRDETLQKDVMAALENDVCALLPGDVANECKTYVSQYGPMVFQILVAELDPKTICETVGFCNATKAATQQTAVPLGSPVGTVHIIPPQQTEKVAATPQCAICEYVMRELQSMISSNSTEQEITAALEQVCNILPNTLKTECDSFVEEYGPEVIQLLLKMAPEAVCTTLGLCVGGNKNQMEQPQAPVKSGELCLVCETVMTYLKNALKDPNNEKTVEQLLDEVCTVVPTSYKGLCDQLVDTYTPAIINLLAQDIDAAKICADLGLCTSKKVESNESKQPSGTLRFKPMMELQPAKMHLLGGEKCTYGPSFWCASVENAKRCNALEHCVKYYNMKVDA